MADKMLAQSEDGLVWFVIYCSSDESHSLINHKKVICDLKHVEIGDAVKFFISKKEYSGLVEDFSDDYNAMGKRLEELNSKKRVQESQPPENRSRLAKTKSRVVVQSAIKAMRRGKISSKEEVPEQDDASCTEHEPPIKQAKGRSKAMAIQSDSEDSVPSPAFLGSAEVTDHNDSDSSSSISEDNSKAERSRKAEVKALKETSQMASYIPIKKPRRENNLVTPSKSDKASEVPVNAPSVQPSASDEPASASNDTASASNDTASASNEPDDHPSESLSNEVAGEPEDFIRKKALKNRPTTRSVKFTGKMFECSENDEDGPVSEIYPGSKVFVRTRALVRIRKTSTSATAMARKLLREVFTAEARDACSVGGNLATGKGRRNVIRRPALDEEGVDVIMQCALARAGKKKWSPTGEANLRAAMGSNLCEDRNKKAALAKVKEARRSSQGTQDNHEDSNRKDE